MKHKLRTILLILVLMFGFMLNVNAEIKENTDAYTGDVYIIGSSRFDSRMIVTGTMASAAGAREMMVQYNVYNNYDFDPSDIRIYYYSNAEEAWSVLPVTSEDKMEYLTEEETEELEENLNIYFVNEVEKTLEIEYEIELEEGYELEFLTHNDSYAKKIKYENGKLIMPASIGNVEIYAVKGDVEDEDYEEYVIGTIEQEEGELNVVNSRVRNLKELQIAMDAEVTYIQIEESIDLPTALEITRPVEIYVSQGVSLTVKEDTAGNGVFHVLDGGDLTVYNDGIIDGVGKNEYNIVVYAEGGRVNLYGFNGVYTNKNFVPTEGAADTEHYDLIYGKNDAEINIYGGRYECKTPLWTLNLKNGHTDASINVYGGTFEQYNPASFERNDNELGETSYLVEGYKVSALNGDYTISQINEIDVAMIDYTAYSFLGDAVAAATENDTIKLIKDIVEETALTITKKVTIDLNGHNITIPEDTAGDGVFHVLDGGDLTINGDGIVDGVGKSEYTMAIYAEGGKTTLNGGTYTNVRSGDYNQYDLIYAKNDAQIIINGGRFESKTPLWTLNIKNENYDASLIVKGGTFVGFNPASFERNDNVYENDYLADGYKVNVNNNEYTVVKAEENELATINGTKAYTSIKDAIAEVGENETIKLIKDIVEETALTITKKVTIDLNGHNITIPEDTAGDGVFHVLDGGDLTINGDGIVDGVGKSEYTMAIYAEGGKTTLNGGTYTNVRSGDYNQYDLIYAKNDAQIIINGGRFESKTPLWTLNIKNENYDASLIVNGGTFVGFNPASFERNDNVYENNYVAEGYEVTEQAGEFVVTKAE